MANIVLRAVKGSALTSSEIDGNFTNLNVRQQVSEATLVTHLTSTENSAFTTNPSTIYVTFTLNTGLNASSVGPITIAENVTITLNSNSNWIIQ
jgi:hypothetical protein